MMWSTALVPETQFDPHVNLPTLAEAIQLALQSRPELVESSLAVDINSLDARLASEATKPRIDAFANLTSAGLAGQVTPTISNNPLASFLPPGFGAVPPLLIGGYGQSLSNLTSGAFATAQVGLQISLPLRNRTATSQAAIANAEGRRLRTQQAQVGMVVEADVRNSLQAATSAQARLEAAGLARGSAEEQYASEQRQFQAGTSSVFLVLQRQTEMISARDREVRARADAAEALANLDRATARTLEARGIRVVQ
jgi:HAE1 family hydrophobic/amphiphilic exporter-1